MTVDINTLTNWVVKLYHSSTPEQIRRDANEKLTTYQHSPLCWTTSLQILKELQGDFSRIQESLPKQTDTNGKQIPAAEVAELLVYFAANALAAQARSAAPFSNAVERGDSLAMMRNEIAQVLFLYRNSASVIVNQLGVAAATSVVFECCRAADPSFTLQLNIDRNNLRELPNQNPEFYNAMNNDLTHAVSVINSVSTLELILKGERISSTISQFWPSSDAYMILSPGPQIEEVMGIFAESPPALVVLLREVAEELAISVERTSQENLLRALGWLMPHTSNIFNFLCNCAGKSVSIKECLDTMTSWLRLHNAIQDGPPQDLTWGRKTAEQDRRQRRLTGSSSSAIPSLLQNRLSEYSLIQGLSDTITDPSSLKSSCEVIVEAAQLHGCITSRTKTTFTLLFNGLAMVAPEITASVCQSNPFAVNSTESVFAQLLGPEGFSEHGPAIGIDIQSVEPIVNFETTDNGVYPKWSINDLEDGADEESDLILIWVSTVGEALNNEAMGNLTRGDLFRFHLDLLQIFEALRKLLFHINFTVRLRVLEVLFQTCQLYYSQNSVIWEMGVNQVDVIGDSEVLTEGPRDKLSDNEFNQAKASCGEFHRCLIRKDNGEYQGIDPAMFFAVLSRSLLLGGMIPSCLGGSEDFVDGEKAYTFVERTRDLWGMSMLSLINVNLWCAAADHILQGINDNNWSLRSIIMSFLSRAVYKILEQDLTNPNMLNDSLSGFMKTLKITAPGLNRDNLVSSALVRSERARMFGSSTSLLFGNQSFEYNVSRETFLEVLGMLCSDIVDLSTTEKRVSQAQNNNNRNVVGDMLPFGNEILKYALKTVVDAFRSFLAGATHLLESLGLMSNELVNETISTYGNIILDENISVNWRVWILSGIGDMIMTQNPAQMVQCHENVISVIMQEVKRRLAIIHEKYQYTPNVNDPTTLLPLSFIRKLNSVVTASAMENFDKSDAESMLCQQFYNILTLFWNAVRCVRVEEHSLNHYNNSLPDDLSLWPPSPMNEMWIHPSMMILEKCFDEVSDISMLACSSNHAVVDSCVQAGISCIGAASSSAMRYPVTTRFVNKVTISHRKNPSIFHFNAIRTLMTSADSKIKGSNTQIMQCIEALRSAVEILVLDVIERIKKDESYLITNPQMVGMAIDTLGTAMNKTGPLAHAIMKNMNTGLGAALHFCVEKLGDAQDVKTLMTMILAISRFAQWWAPSRSVVRTTKESNPLLHELNVETTKAAREFATQEDLARKFTSSNIRLAFTNFETNDQWLGLSADALYQVCQPNSPFRAEGLEGVQHGLTTLSGQCHMEQSKMNECYEKLMMAFTKTNTHLTNVLKECVSEHKATIRMRNFA